MKKPDNSTRLPEAFVQRLRLLTNEQTFASVCDAFAVKRPTTVRVNRLRADTESVGSSLDRLGIQHETVSWHKDACILPDISAKELTETDIYKDGHIYIQSLSSMIPALILAPEPADNILDIAAAPGSKTTQLASLMGNEGSITANDTSFVRRQKLGANLRIQGVLNTEIVNHPAQGIWETYPEHFDKTLVDVPCSMEGRFAISLPKTYESWSVSKVRTLAHQQRWMLKSAISATKPGGRIVYSTCTLSPEENEDVVSWILQKMENIVTLEDIQGRFPFFAPAVTSWQKKLYHHDVRMTARILPSELMEGFYIASFRKTASNMGRRIS